MERIVKKIENWVCDLKVKEDGYKKKITKLEKELASLTEDYKAMRKLCENLQQYIDSFEVEE